MTRYTGLQRIADKQLEKRAFLEGWEATRASHPIATTVADLIPGVGTGTALLDAGRAFSQGRILSGIGNTAMGALMLVPGAGLVTKGIGAVGKGLMRLAPRLGKAVRQGAVGYRTAARAVKPYAGWKGFGAGLGLSIGGGMVDDALLGARNASQTANQLPQLGLAQRGPVPYGTGGFFQPQLPPSRYRALYPAPGTRSEFIPYA